MTPSHRDPERKSVLQLYAALAAALILTVIPNILAAVAALVLFLGGLIAAYVMRRKSKAEGDLLENHCTYIIRTLWISGFLSLLTMIVASIYMLPRINNAPLEPCLGGILENAGNLQNESIAALSDLLQPCMSAYIQVNFQVLMISMLIGAGPVFLYFLFRFMRGFSRALGGYRVSNPKSWF